MLTAFLAALLFALVFAPITRTLRPGFRRTPSSHERQRRAPAPDLAAVLDSIARQVRSGSSLNIAVVAALDGSAPLGDVGARLRSGSSLTSALSCVAPGDPDVALAVQALSATAHLGGPIAATLDAAAAVLRERGAARAERLAHGAQARLSARVLTIVPLCFAIWSAASSERTRDVYLSSVAGSVCALAGLALNLAGWRWMRKIIGAP